MNMINMSNQRFFEDLKRFIADNGVVGTTAGVIIAVTTKDLILSLVSDIIMPLILMLLLSLNLKSVSAFISSKNLGFNFTNFSNLFITWVITLVITFYFIKGTFQWFLGVSVYKQKDESKKENFV